jgi:hypothetical protein
MFPELRALRAQRRDAATFLTSSLNAPDARELRSRQLASRINTR